VSTLSGELNGVNPACLGAVGYTDDELIGRSFVTLLHPDDIARTGEAIACVHRGAAPCTHVRRNPTDDRHRITLRVTTVPRRSEVRPDRR
jgi:PAS domain S-box-containing protein